MNGWIAFVTHVLVVAAIAIAIALLAAGRMGKRLAVLVVVLCMAASSGPSARSPDQPPASPNRGSPSAPSPPPTAFDRKTPEGNTMHKITIEIGDNITRRCGNGEPDDELFAATLAFAMRDCGGDLSDPPCPVLTMAMALENIMDDQAVDMLDPNETIQILRRVIDRIKDAWGKP